MMRANPEPHDVASVQNAEGTIVNAHPHRVHWAPLAHTLEIQAWMAEFDLKER
jgi:hypothetical protein